MKDGNDNNRFLFPEGLLVEPRERLILARNPDKFRSVFPGVAPVLGPFSFGLNDERDQIRLIDPSRQTYLQISYSNTAPWPVLKQGQAHNLQLIDPFLDPQSPGNWKAGRLENPSEAE